MFHASDLETIWKQPSCPGLFSRRQFQVQLLSIVDVLFGRHKGGLVVSQIDNLGLHWQSIWFQLHITESQVGFLSIDQDTSSFLLIVAITNVVVVVVVVVKSNINQTIIQIESLSNRIKTRQDFDYFGIWNTLEFGICKNGMLNPNRSMNHVTGWNHKN